MVTFLRLNGAQKQNSAILSPSRDTTLYSYCWFFFAGARTEKENFRPPITRDRVVVYRSLCEVGTASTTTTAAVMCIAVPSVVIFWGAPKNMRGIYTHTHTSHFITHRQRDEPKTCNNITDSRRANTHHDTII